MSAANMNEFDDAVMRELLGLMLMYGDSVPALDDSARDLTAWIDDHPGYWTEAYSSNFVAWHGTYGSVFVTDKGKAFFEGGNDD